MNGRNPKRNSSRNKKGKRNLKNEESHFQQDSKRRRKSKHNTVYDAEIESDESEEVDDFFEEDNQEKKEEEQEEDEFEKETVDERRYRIANDFLQRVKSIKRKEEEEEEDESDGEEEDSDKEERVKKKTESIVAKYLQQEQLEESGRARRLLASKLQKPDEEPRLLVKHRQPVTSVALSDDDLRGFSASKDGTIMHWDIESGKNEKYIWPSEDVLKSHGVKEPHGSATKHSKQVLALAVSTDGRYLATGGFDRHVHLWDTRTREHIQAFPGHRGLVSCLSFRQGTPELYSGSFDRTVKIWNVEDRAYITTLFAHQSEVLSIDCLRKERALTVGRDRTMMLYKVPEESRLIFRAPATSLECCCFVNNDAFFSGSDAGSVELWSISRKKPVSIVKNAHALSPTNKKLKLNDDDDRIPNGDIGHNQAEDNHNSNSLSSTALSWVSSVAVCSNSDLAASGAGNGFVRLWAIESENRGIRPLFDISMMGFVNSLAFAKSGQFLIAGIGKEPRLGRWGRVPAARNGVCLQSFKSRDADC